MSKRQELAAKLQTNILWFALGNLILGVFIFVWQLVYFFFNYAEVNAMPRLNYKTSIMYAVVRIIIELCL